MIIRLEIPIYDITHTLANLSIDDRLKSPVCLLIIDMSGGQCELSVIQDVFLYLPSRYVLDITNQEFASRVNPSGEIILEIADVRKILSLIAVNNYVSHVNIVNRDDKIMAILVVHFDIKVHAVFSKYAYLSFELFPDKSCNSAHILMARQNERAIARIDAEINEIKKQLDVRKQYMLQHPMQ